MRLFLDTNIVLATVIDETGRAQAATRLLNHNDYAFITSSINVMELRSVLTKKARIERQQVEEIVADFLSDVEVFMPDGGDLTDAVGIQKQTLLYPVDAIILACANAADSTLVTFDSELLEHEAVEPGELL